MKGIFHVDAWFCDYYKDYVTFIAMCNDQIAHWKMNS